MRARGKVFISYARADSEFVDRLYAFLKENGYAPWLDRENISPGEDFRKAIRGAIHDCDAFLLVISRNSAGRDGVIAGELREGLKLLSERLDSGYLIPIRIDDTAIPADVEHLHAIDARKAEDWSKLAIALQEKVRWRRRRLRPFLLVSAAVLLAIVALFAYRNGLGRVRSMSDYDTALTQRPGAPRPAEPANLTQLGVTLWAVRGQTEGTRCTDLQFDRLALDARLAWGDHVRLTVEPSRRGYLYIVNEELAATGEPLNARLLYPSAVMNSNIEPLAPGRLIEVPPTIGADICPTFQLMRNGPGHGGEALNLIFAKDRIPELAPGPDSFKMLGPDVMQAIRAIAVSSDRSSRWDEETGKRRSEQESAAVKLGEERSLDYFAPRPQSLFTSTETKRPILVQIRLNPR